jgi:nitroreductase
MQAQRQQHSQVMEFLRNRRSVPAKALAPEGPGPGEDEIRQMIAIASRVPDHGKIAPWRFIRYSAKYCSRLGSRVLERALELNPELNEEMQEIEKSRFLRAPVVIGIVSCPREHPKVPEWEQVLSCGAAGMNLLHAANALGWDAQWLTEWVAFDEKLAPHLGAGNGERIAGFIHVGVRTMPKSERDRPDLDDIFETMDIG